MALTDGMQMVGCRNLMTLFPVLSFLLRRAGDRPTHDRRNCSQARPLELHTGTPEWF